MKEPLFSIVVPTFNRSDLVTHTIRSVLAQTCDDFEILVCDNCSTDDTAEVVSTFGDPRIRCVRPPRHMVIADNWEFARGQARGAYIMMLADDDTLVATALERFRQDIARHNADFLFCKMAEYRDGGFPGPYRNSLNCPVFSGTSRVMPADVFLRSMFSFRLDLNYHPSAFVFAKSLGDRIVARCGRLFQTNGVEYFAWPLASVFATKIIEIDEPLTICGRTGKSWGSNLVLFNPGKKRIQKFLDDVDHERKCVPLRNFMMANLAAEGLLTAKALAPEKFAMYEFDEQQYLRRTMNELKTRSALGVNVSHEMDELLEYARKYPALVEELRPVRPRSLLRRIRSRAGRLRDRLLDWIESRAEARRLRVTGSRKVRIGDVRSGFRVWGADVGFCDATGCADFLTVVVSRHRDSLEISARQIANTPSSAVPLER